MMISRSLKAVACIFGIGILTVQSALSQQVFTSDVTNFWIAYDSVLTTQDDQQQLQLIQALYIEKATPGLEAFMTLRHFGADRLVSAINDYPKFWRSIRPNTLKVLDKQQEIDKHIAAFHELYPWYREANIYFTITAIRSGGTTRDSMVLIGTEIATGNAETDVSEFPDKRLESFFHTQEEDNIIPFVVHEYVHTQQRTEGTSLLGQSIYEGACDFITELVLDTHLEHAYLVYGKENEEELKERFRKEMFSEDYSGWIYNGSTAETVGDLGYFMGYAICASFYEHASDKQLAVKEIIELDYSDAEALRQFLDEAAYYD